MGDLIQTVFFLIVIVSGVFVCVCVCVCVSQVGLELIM
jgi:hypothetical protein